MSDFAHPEQIVTQDSPSDDGLFQKDHQLVESRNAVRLVRDLPPILVPSAETSTSYIHVLPSLCVRITGRSLSDNPAATQYAHFALDTFPAWKSSDEFPEVYIADAGGLAMTFLSRLSKVYA